MSTYGVGIIGLGAVGRRFVEQYQGHDGFELVAAWDVADGARDAAQADFGAPVVDSADAVIGHDDVDMVYIAVPPLFHETYVDAVLAAGKTIFCEKPLGVDDAQSAAMTARVADAGARAAVNFVFASAPSATALGELVASGAAGEVVGAELRLHFAEWPRPFQADAHWLRDRDQGGWTREVVSHFVFLAERLFGPGTLRSASAWFPPDGTSEQALAAVVDFAEMGSEASPDGIQLRIVGSSDSGGADEVEFIVWGSERSFRISNWYQLTATEPDGSWVAVEAAGVAGGPAVAGPAAYAAQLAQVANLCAGDEHILATFEEALRVQVLVEAMVSAEGDR